MPKLVPLKDKKTEQVKVTLTKTERKQLNEIAEAHGLSITSLISTMIKNAHSKL